jgi:type IV secretion system protein VirB6/type IV secretion system protein TrbL
MVVNLEKARNVNGRKSIMKMEIDRKNLFCYAVGIFLILFAVDAQAEINNIGLFNNILETYKNAAGAWAATITAHASKLFWELALISMVWTFGFMALRKADIGEFFAEFVRFTIFTGFFWWLLINGPNFANSLIDSMRQIGGEATGLKSTLSPSGIVDVGFMIFDRIVDGTTKLHPIDSLAGFIIATIILVILALIAINMLMLLISSWILAYAGIFFLGFGGSRWTSEIAIHYYKTVLGIATQLFAMVLIVGIGKFFVDDYYQRMSEGVVLKETAVMLIVAVTLLILSNKIPSMLSGIITGASVGHIGIGNFGAGAAVGAAGTAAAMAISAAKEATGGAQAVIAASKMAQEHMAEGSGAFKVSGAGGFGSSSGSGGLIGGLSSAIGNNILTGLDVVSNLAQAGKSVASDHIQDSTLGGKMVNAMGDFGAKGNSSNTNAGNETGKPTFDGNSIGSGKQESMPLTGIEEIDNFVNKNS